MLGRETVPAINANIAAHLLRPRDPPVGSLVVKELQRDMLAHAEQQRLAGAAPCAAPGAATAGRARDVRPAPGGHDYEHRPQLWSRRARRSVRR